MYALRKKELYEKILQDVKDGNAGNIHAELYKSYSDNLKNAISGVLGAEKYADKYFGMQMKLQANVSRFAAYKAYHCTEQLKKQFENNPESFDKIGKAVLNTFNRYQAAEYNTAVARSRTAKQWHDFNADPISNELYPNLKWLPSRSADPREQHIAFYGLVLPKTDPFWQANQPGNLWNCKCDWEQTDDSATSIYPEKNIFSKGLDGNPAVTGEVFTDECTYIKNAGENRKDKVEIQCQTTNQKYTVTINKDLLLNTTSECTIKGEAKEVIFIPEGIKHYSRDMLGDTKRFWIKNTILNDIDNYIKSAKCIGRKVSDATHNTRKETVKLKENTDYFYYFEITLPNKTTSYLHLGRFKGEIKDAGKFYLYSITKNLPKNIETL